MAQTADQHRVATSQRNRDCDPIYGVHPLLLLFYPSHSFKLPIIDFDLDFHHFLECQPVIIILSFSLDSSSYCSPSHKVLIQKSKLSLNPQWHRDTPSHPSPPPLTFQPCTVAKPSQAAHNTFLGEHSKVLTHSCSNTRQSSLYGAT